GRRRGPVPVRAFPVRLRTLLHHPETEGLEFSHYQELCDKIWSSRARTGLPGFSVCSRQSKSSGPCVAPSSAFLSVVRWSSRGINVRRAKPCLLRSLVTRTKAVGRPHHRSGRRIWTSSRPR